uniref:RRM domain-containing protein n=1 Tax=Mycena chlorophos TaxID=658473 RepID=A0ABQ0LZA5_MYCCL|nr:predicted protein [Mycena chlorophos]
MSALRVLVATASRASLRPRPVSNLNACLRRPLSTTTPRRLQLPVIEKQSQSPPSKYLYIGNLPYEVTEAEVRNALSPYGSIDSLRLVINPDGSSRGFGYVLFNRLDSAVAAFNAEIKLVNRLMRVDYTTQRPAVNPGMGLVRPPSPPSATLYVGNMPFGTDEAEIREKFAPFGSIRSVRLGLDPSGSFRGYCHVDYEREEDAIAAFESFAEEPLYMLDRNVKIDYAAARVLARGSPSSSLYFFDFRGDGLALRRALRAFERDILRTYFLRNKVTGELTSTGFVEFRTIEAATAALEKYNGTTTQFGPINLEFAVSRSSRTLGDQLQSDSPAGRAQAGYRAEGGAYKQSDF